MLKPDIGYWASLPCEYREGLIQAGQHETPAQAHALRALHAGPGAGDGHEQPVSTIARQATSGWLPSFADDCFGSS